MSSTRQSSVTCFLRSREELRCQRSCWLPSLEVHLGTVGCTLCPRYTANVTDLRPTISGSLAEATGWRQIMWLCVGVAGVIEILFVTLFRETYHPTILKRRAAQKRRETGDDSYITEYDEHDQGAATTLTQSMLRPLRIFWSSSMLQYLSVWSGVTFAFFYVNSTCLPEMLEVIYGFSPSKRGLSYLAWSKSFIILPSD